MNSIRRIFLLALFVCCAMNWSASAQSSAFTYQGRLTTAGTPANGAYEVTFTLYDTATNGTAIGSQTVAPLPVTNGLFAATLDFGSGAFNGAPRWLEISLSIFGTDMVQTTLQPRQPITSTPYAIHAANAANLMNLESAPLDIKVNGVRAFRLEPHAFGPNVVGGTSENDIVPGVYAAVIGGGMDNHIGSPNSTISGGNDNSIWENSSRSTIGGGDDNHIYRGSHGSTIGGGQNNAVVNAMYSTVAGGNLNRVSAGWATVGGGADNEAGALFTTIGGGMSNIVTGAHAFWRFGAKALHYGSFVWADGVEAEFYSTEQNQFNVRAAGGVRIFSNSETNVGVELPPGSGTWSALSDRNAKENFQPANAREILEKVAALPLATWNYRSQDKSIRHIGPMAQDFRAAFGLGENDRTISAVDADGVSLAAIQGLNQKIEAENRDLRDALRSRDAQLTDLQERLSRIEGMLKQPAVMRD